MQTFYLSPPATWPFKSPTIPAKLMPSRNSYTRNAQGLVLVDQTDLLTLLGLGFYLYGSTPNLNDFVSNLSNSGDATKYLNGVGTLSTPASGGGSGEPTIDSGIISSPVPWLKSPALGLALPSSYMWYDFTVAGLGFTNFASSYETLTFVVSSDSGATWLNDTEHADSYLTVYAPGTPDMVGFFADAFSSNSFGVQINARIYPGSADKMFSVISHFAVMKDGNIVGSQPCITMPNPNATVPYVASRINMIRVKAYDDGNVSNPAPTHGIAKAVWSLMGAPNPT